MPGFRTHDCIVYPIDVFLFQLETEKTFSGNVTLAFHAAPEWRGRECTKPPALLPGNYLWPMQSKNSRPLGPRLVEAMTHKYTHKLQTFPAIGSRLVAHLRSELNYRKSFIQRSFGINQTPSDVGGQLEQKHCLARIRTA